MDQAIEQSAEPLAASPPTISLLRIIRLAAGYGATLVSLLLHFVVMMCFINQWDRAAAVTVFPVWIWALGGILVAFAGWLTFRNRIAIVAAGIWIVTVVFASDETSGMIRVFQKKLTESHPGTFHGKTVYRVVTLNCSNRNVDAAAETGRFNPDIVLLQEVPRVKDVEGLAKEMFGEQGTASANWYCAVLAKGEVRRRGSSGKPPYEFVTISLPDGASIDAFSIHLEHAVTRWDLWRPDCWRSHARNRRERRTQLRTILNQYPKTADAGKRPCLFGGDFNAPPSDPIFDLLQNHFKDAFKTAGRGWGNTFFNRLPALRIDQIWSTKKLIPINARVVPTQHSDHRMLVVDYVLNGPTGKH